MVKNLLNTGTVFDYNTDDQNFINDILNVDLNNSLEVTENQSKLDPENNTFEDEI